MGLFSKLRGKGIDEHVSDAHAQNIQIIDVREPNEFAQGHIPGAINTPLSNLSAITKVAPDKSAPLYLHCQSGHRSSRACKKLKSMGYIRTVNMGGINSYHGPLER